MMQTENLFDKLSKRLTVAVSRRTLLHSFSFSIAGAFLPWAKVIAQSKAPTSSDLETKFMAAPVVMERLIAGKVTLRCIAIGKLKTSGGPVIGATSASKDGECPSEISKYFENTELLNESDEIADFDKSKIYNVKVVEGRSRLMYTDPVATSYSFINPDTGEKEYEAYCSSLTYLDPRVHKGDPDLKMIHYERQPIPKQLTSLNDPVTCGDINYAYENEIKTRKPIALRDFSVNSVPHQASAKRVNATGASTNNHSGHKSK